MTTCCGIVISGNCPTCQFREELKQHFNDFYDGKIARPCDDDCPKDCDGKHNYEMVTEFEPIFEEKQCLKT